MALKSIVIPLTIFFSVVFTGYAETPEQSVIQLVQEASVYISENGKRVLRRMNADINHKWKRGNEYIFVVDCVSGRTLIHVKKAVIGKNLLTKLKDKKTGRFFLKDMCQATDESPKGVWLTYWWAKPKETRPSRKVSFVKRNDRYSSYMVGAGIYSETLDTTGLNTRMR